MAHADAEQHWSASAPDVATALGMPDYRDDGSNASDVDRHDTPLLHDPVPPARVKKKHGAAKRIYVTASSGEKTMRCASVYDSLETSQRGMVRRRPQAAAPPRAPCSPWTIRQLNVCTAAAAPSAFSVGPVPHVHGH